METTQNKAKKIRREGSQIESPLKPWNLPVWLRSGLDKKEGEPGRVSFTKTNQVMVNTYRGNTLTISIGETIIRDTDGDFYLSEETVDHQIEETKEGTNNELQETTNEEKEITQEPCCSNTCCEQRDGCCKQKQEVETQPPATEEVKINGHDGSVDVNTLFRDAVTQQRKPNWGTQVEVGYSILPDCSNLTSSYVRDVIHYEYKNIDGHGVMIIAITRSSMTSQFLAGFMYDGSNVVPIEHEHTECQQESTYSLTPGEAVFGFMSWLANRDCGTFIGMDEDPEELGAICSAFVQANDLDNQEDGEYAKKVIYPSDDDPLLAQYVAQGHHTGSNVIDLDDEDEEEEVEEEVEA